MNKEEAIKLLTRDHVSWGGYPDIVDYETIPGYLIIASSDNDEPDLTVYKMENIDNWIRQLESFDWQAKGYESLHEAASLEEIWPTSL